VQPQGPPPTATNTSSVTTYAVRVKEEYITSPGVQLPLALGLNIAASHVSTCGAMSCSSWTELDFSVAHPRRHSSPSPFYPQSISPKHALFVRAVIPPVQLKQLTGHPATVDLSLEAEILAAESTSGRPTTNSNPSDISSLLAGMGHPAEPARPVHIPTVDALDGQLQAMSAAAVNAAEGDEQALRLALLKCSEHDEKGIVEFCVGMKQVLDVTNGQMGKMDVAMRLVAGEAPMDIIRSHSF
jgi:hypothetical protein